jgi:hypothetical protein
VRTEEGKWRWVQYDMDHGLSKFGKPEYDMVYHTAFDDEHSHLLLVELLKNQEFKNLFLNQFADNLNTFFLPSVEVNHFTKMASELQPYIPEYQNRWQLNFDWDEGIMFGLDIVNRRNNLRWEQLIRNFELKGRAPVMLQSDPTMGSIKFNSINISSETPGIIDPSKWTGFYFLGLPIEISAVPETGYRFVRWDGINEEKALSSNISFILRRNMLITAVFEKIN